MTVTTNSAGNANFTATVARTPGMLITATATEGGTTSDFSNAVEES